MAMRKSQVNNRQYNVYFYSFMLDKKYIISLILIPSELGEKFREIIKFENNPFATFLVQYEKYIGYHCKPIHLFNVTNLAGIINCRKFRLF